MKDSFASLNRAQLETELRAAREIIEMFSTTVMGGVARMSMEDMHLITATDGYYRMTGYTREESLLPPFSNRGLNLVLPEDMGALNGVLQRLLIENKPIRADYRIRKRDGSIAWSAAFCPGVGEDENGKYFDVFFIDTTEERNTQLQLASLLENMTTGLARFEVGPGLRLLYANGMCYRQIARTAEQCAAPPVENDYLRLVHPDDRAGLLALADRLVHSEEGHQSSTFRILRPDGEERWMTAQLSRLYEELPGERLLQCLLTDVTEQRARDRQEQLNEKRFRIISEQTRDVIFEWDIVSDRLHYSPVYERMFGAPPPGGLTATALLLGDVIHPDDKPIIAKLIEDIRTTLPYAECKVRLRCADGDYFWALHRVTALGDGDRPPTHAVGIISDINDLVESALALQRKAEHDPLTGLLNRTAGQQLISDLLDRDVSTQNAAFVQLDIDRFKQINDFMGHAAGDLALQKIAMLMRELFREQDLLIRMGGDEFAVFLVRPGVRENIVKKLRLFLQEINCDFKFEEKIYPLSVSIGVALYPEDGSTFQELYEQADLAMYRAKRGGGNRCEFYRASYRAKAAR